jgi:hypothetical protein
MRNAMPPGNGFLVMLKVYLDRGAKSDSGDDVVGQWRAGI